VIWLLLSYSRDRILSFCRRDSIKDTGKRKDVRTQLNYLLFTNILVIDIITRIIPWQIQAHTRESFLYKVGLSRYIDAVLFVGGYHR
jgi:hypothetical protein